MRGHVTGQYFPAHIKTGAQVTRSAGSASGVSAAAGMHLARPMPLLLASQPEPTGNKCACQADATPHVIGCPDCTAAVSSALTMLLLATRFLAMSCLELGTFQALANAEVYPLRLSKLTTCYTFLTQKHDPCRLPVLRWICGTGWRRQGARSVLDLRPRCVQKVPD